MGLSRASLCIGEVGSREGEGEELGGDPSLRFSVPGLEPGDSSSYFGRLKSSLSL
mgnify:CR=1 FL=1